MSKNKDILEAMKADAFWAYLEFCNAIKEVPRKELYDAIKNCTDGIELDKITSIIETNHSDFEKNNKED